MLNWINSWLRGIVIAVIISTIIEMIIPNGNIKKYIKTVIGVYIVFTIISPVISKITGKEINLAEYINYQTEKYQPKEIAIIDTNYYIKIAYIENIKQDITKEINAKGYDVTKVQIEIEEGEAEYGKIKRLQLGIQKNTSDIKPIEISVNETEEKRNSSITEENIGEIKKLLETTYGIEPNNIIIN